jgi:tRNA nucleotidyltransferase (CCA-adding enzyme)
MPALAIFANYLTTDDNEARNFLKRYSHEWQHVLPKISGHDLQEMGLPPGPAYKQIIAALRDAWLDGEVKSTEAEKKLLEKLIRDDKNDNSGDD